MVRGMYPTSSACCATAMVLTEDIRKAKTQDGGNKGATESVAVAEGHHAGAPSLRDARPPDTGAYKARQARRGLHGKHR
jgi:hypothetical protein